MSRIERSPNTVRAYAQDLKAFWEFLAARSLVWDRLTLEQLGLFMAWLRQPADNVVLLAGAEPRRAPSTVNRMLSAVMGFYDFHARHGVTVAQALVDARFGSSRFVELVDEEIEFRFRLELVEQEAAGIVVRDTHRRDYPLTFSADLKDQMLLAALSAGRVLKAGSASNRCRFFAGTRSSSR